MLLELIIYAALNIEASSWQEEYVQETMGIYANTFAFIFIENLKTSLLIVVSGIVPFFLGSIASVTMSVFGLVMSMKYLLQEFTIMQMIICILPHGVFEISAIIFSIMLSAIFCKEVMLIIYRSIFKGAKFLSELGRTIIMIAKGWILVGVPLILMGAMVESTVSVVVTKMVVG